MEVQEAVYKHLEEKMLRSKKAQTGGLITGLIFGIASLVIGVIIAFVIVNTLIDAELLQDGRTTGTVINESSYINATGDTLAGASVTKFVSGSISISEAINLTSNETILSGNYTVSDAGVITNITTVNYANVVLSYTYTLKTDTEVSADGLNTNFTAGVDNVSDKIPTILLVAAIVLILGVLVLLVATWQRMNMGGGL